MSIIVAFVALVELTLENLGLLFLLSCSRLLPLMSFLCEGVWVLDLMGWGPIGLDDGEGLDSEAL